MPRRHRSARERSAPPGTTGPPGLAPAWAQTEGFLVRQVTGERSYRCPGCHQEIHPGVVHLVVIPEEQLDLRRHWHTPCWLRERRSAR